MRLGSLFTGAAGLDMAVESVLGTETAWHAEIDPGACKVLAHRYPDVPNLGDVTAIDWSQVEPVDVICGGSPCQDVSAAGRRAGMRAGTRSGLWASMVDAIDVLRPSLVVWENVKGVLSAEADSALEPCAGCVGDGDDGSVLRALGRVLGDLAELGYDTRWCGLRAADIGAPHGRFRVFVVAYPNTVALGCGTEGWDDGVRAAGLVQAFAHSADGGHAASGTGGHAARLPEPAGDHEVPADSAGWGGQRRRFESSQSDGAPDVSARCGDDSAPDASGNGRNEGRTESAGIVRGSDAAQRSAALAADANHDSARNGCEPRDAGSGRTESAQCGDAAADADSDGLARLGRELAVERDADRRGDTDIAWGDYEPAIRRWERLTRPAPSPTEIGPKGGRRLSARFAEWMMGWPDGWVTDVPGISRNEALRICGNGVVPQQAAAALSSLLAVDAAERVA